ncbi:MAG: hypothetical protein AAFX00_02875 [Pseudomonadota bacterium]
MGRGRPVVAAGAVCLLTFAAGCGGLSENTFVASSAGARAAMVASMEPGLTTEGDVQLRWGYPSAKKRQGGQVEYIYVDHTTPGAPYVIVVFQYGLVSSVRTIGDEPCRAQLRQGPWNENRHLFPWHGPVENLHRPCPDIGGGAGPTPAASPGVPGTKGTGQQHDEGFMPLQPGEVMSGAGT